MRFNGFDFTKWNTGARNKKMLIATLFPRGTISRMQTTVKNGHDAAIEPIVKNAFTFDFVQVLENDGWPLVEAHSAVNKLLGHARCVLTCNCGEEGESRCYVDLFACESRKGNGRKDDSYELDLWGYNGSIKIGCIVTSLGDITTITIYIICGGET